MLRLCLLFALLFAFFFSSSEAQGRIVGGTPANQGQFPWLCRLVIPISSTSDGLCGASIIGGGFYLLTAAHCFNEFSPQNVSVGQIFCQAGVANISATAAPTYQQRFALDYKVHPLYNKTDPNFFHDIAYIRLLYPFDLGNDVSTIPLATSLPSKGSAFVAGWGTTSSGGQISTNLLYVQLPLASSSTCTKTYGKFNSTLQVCAGGVVGQDSCQGDSGGSLFTTKNVTHPTDAQVIGLVSYGQGCGENVPGVYTNVPKFGLSWVQQQLSSVRCRNYCNIEFRICKRASIIGQRLCKATKNRCFNACLPLHFNS